MFYTRAVTSHRRRLARRHLRRRYQRWRRRSEEGIGHSTTHTSPAGEVEEATRFFPLSLQRAVFGLSLSSFIGNLEIFGRWKIDLSFPPPLPGTRTGI